jgi:thiol-disulfide isomerase/thioredoxin
VTLAVVSKLAAGDMYQEISKVSKMGEEGDTTISHKEGDVILLDFWATWCPPCQAPMAHNQTMLEKRGAEWGSNVRIVGLSIDQAKDAMSKHVEDKKWTSIEHYHRHESDCSSVYGVNGVPHVMLINKEGRIVFKGHPSIRKDLEDDLTKLGKGEQLEGEGIVNGPVAGGDAEKP